MEVWRDVVGYEGTYKVSNFGRVKRIKPAKGAVANRVLKPGIGKGGAKHVLLYRDSKPKNQRVHRLVALAFLGSPPSNLHVVAHNDGNASNNRLANLRWATQSENTFDKIRHGTQRGRHYGRRSAITDDQVIAMRADKRPVIAIARDYGISASTVSQIRRRETHKHIPKREGDYEPKRRYIGFTNEQVRAIRKDPRANSEIASEIGCSPVSVWSIKTRKTYGHVSDNGSPPGEEKPTNKHTDDGIEILGDVCFLRLTQGRTLLFDLCDFDFVRGRRWHGTKSKYTNYAYTKQRFCDGTVKTFLLHRLLMNPPEGMVVDHINGDGLDNRRANLRVVTVAQNNLNSRVRSDNVSGIKGAFYDKRHGTYYSRIKHNGRCINLGTFQTAEEAAQAYADASAKYHGSYAV